MNSSHAPKVMQSLYHLKQAIDAYDDNANNKESVKMFGAGVTEPPMGCSVKNVPTLLATIVYKMDAFNEEDAVVVSGKFLEKLRSINYRTVAVIMKEHRAVYRVCHNGYPLQPGELILQIDADKVTLSTNYLKCEQTKKGLWHVTFTKEYSDKLVFIKNIHQNGRILTIVLKSFHHAAVGDKLTTMHGQKCTIAAVGRQCVDMLVSATCLKRLPVGEVMYAHLVSLVRQGALPAAYPHLCFGYEWLLMDISVKQKLLQALYQRPTNTLIFYVMRLTQEAESTLSFANNLNIIRDQWVGQNLKGLINTGSSAFTLPGFQSLELMGMTHFEHLLRFGTEDPSGYTQVEGATLSKTAMTSLLILSQFNNFNIKFKS